MTHSHQEMSNSIQEMSDSDQEMSRTIRPFLPYEDYILRISIFGDTSTLQVRKEPYRTWLEVKVIYDQFCKDFSDFKAITTPCRSASELEWRYKSHLVYILDDGRFPQDLCLISLLPWSIPELTKIQQLLPECILNGRGQDTTYAICRNGIWYPDWRAIREVMLGQSTETDRDYKYSTECLEQAYNLRIGADRVEPHRGGNWVASPLPLLDETPSEYPPETPQGPQHIWAGDDAPPVDLPVVREDTQDASTSSAKGKMPERPQGAQQINVENDSSLSVPAPDESEEIISQVKDLSLEGEMPVRPESAQQAKAENHGALSVISPILVAEIVPESHDEHSPKGEMCRSPQGAQKLEVDHLDDVENAAKNA